MCFFEDECPRIHTVSDYCPTNFIATIAGTKDAPCITITCVNRHKSFSIELSPKHIPALTEAMAEITGHLNSLKATPTDPRSAQWCIHTIVTKA